jgi:hypothetical protein
MKVKLLISLVIITFIASGCATYNPYNANVIDKQLEGINNKTTNIFLIGDAGKPEEDGTAPKALVKLQHQFNKADENDLLLFLGDNIYPKGIPLKDDEAIKTAKKALTLQLEVAKTCFNQKMAALLRK